METIDLDGFTSSSACVKTIGDTISMPNWLDGEPWFSSEVGKDFLKRENGGVLYYIIFGEEGIDSNERF